MRPTLLRADRCLHAVAIQVTVWQPGAYAGTLYTAFADAFDALAHLEPGERAEGRDRLTLLAARVGMVLPALDDIGGSAAWRQIGSVATRIDPWHLVKVLAALFPQPSFQARVDPADTGTVALWAAMPPAEGRTFLLRIDATLRRFRVRRVVGACRTTPAAD